MTLQRSLFDFDRNFGPLIVGVDEVGRGCLAGPIIGAGVLFDYDRIKSDDIEELAKMNDSKKLTHKMREELFEPIKRVAKRVSIIIRTPEDIDARGLHKMNIEVLTLALSELQEEGCVNLVDGFDLKECPFNHHKIIKGDAQSAAIAGASIIAKVTRDRYMLEMSEVYPGYAWEKNMGYGTAAHKAGLIKLGLTPLHRKSFKCSAYPA